MRLALYEPDIPQNTGSMLRLCACLAVPLELIEPAGFTFTDRALRRAALDYAPMAAARRHRSWEAFRAALPEPGGRLVLLTTGASLAYTDFAYDPRDVLLVGREEAGVPESVHAAADVRVRIPMLAEARSLNVAQAAAMVLGEALRQQGWPGALLPRPERGGTA